MRAVAAGVHEPYRGHRHPERRHRITPAPLALTDKTMDGVRLFLSDDDAADGQRRLHGG
ncbi:MAG: hypothetical protein ACLUNO_10060 [Oscillospiraceae bacterium]